jgi:hypothetical protein
MRQRCASHRAPSAATGNTATCRSTDSAVPQNISVDRESLALQKAAWDIAARRSAHPAQRCRRQRAALQEATRSAARSNAQAPQQATRRRRGKQRAGAAASNAQALQQATRVAAQASRAAHDQTSMGRATAACARPRLGTPNTSASILITSANVRGTVTGAHHTASRGSCMNGRQAVTGARHRASRGSCMSGRQAVMTCTPTGPAVAHV